MPETLSKIFVSGDLGQAVAISNGVALIFNGTTVSEATNAEVNMFFNIAMELEELPSGSPGSENFRILSEYVSRTTIKADALRFLLVGMDNSLSSVLRLKSIQQAASLLDDVETAGHVRDRFLKIANPEVWDSRSAAILAVMIEANLPALLYLAASDPEMLQGLKALSPEQLTTADARSEVERHVSPDGSESAQRRLWKAVADRLGAPGSPDVALAAATWFVEQFGQVRMAGVRAQVAQALIYSAAIRYIRTGDASSSLEIFDDAIARSRELEGNALQTTSAIAMSCKAAIFGRRNELAEAIEMDELAIGLLAERRDPLSRDWAATAHFALAYHNCALGRTQAAIDYYDEMLTEFEASESDRIRTLAAKALYNRAHALLSLGLAEEARGRFREIALHMKAVDPDILPVLRAKAEYNVGWISGSLGDQDMAVRFYQAAMETCSAISGGESEAVRLRAFYNLGTILGGAGKHREAISIYREVVELIRNREADDSEKLAAQALYNLALSLEALARHAEASDTYRTIETRFAQVRGVRQIAAKARARRSQLKDTSPQGEKGSEDPQTSISEAGIDFSFYRTRDEEP